MKIPLLISAKPANVQNGPVVYLHTGNWVIESDHDTSEVIMALSPSEELVCKSGLQIQGPCSVHVFVRTPGKEQQLNISAIKQ